MEKNISFKLRYWRQNGPKDKGHFDEREMKDIPGDTSFLEMLDILNEQLVEEGKEPFVFDHDCREGSAVCVLCTSTVRPTARPNAVPPPASSICVSSRTAIDYCGAVAFRRFPRHQGLHGGSYGFR